MGLTRLVSRLQIPRTIARGAEVKVNVEALPAGMVDTDHDGIFDNVDTQPDQISFEFSDKKIQPPGKTDGKIIPGPNESIHPKLTVKDANKTTDGILVDFAKDGVGIVNVTGSCPQSFFKYTT